MHVHVCTDASNSLPQRIGPKSSLKGQNHTQAPQITLASTPPPDEMERNGQSRFAPCGKLGGFKSLQNDTMCDLSLGTQTRAWAHTISKIFSAESSIVATRTRPSAPPSRVERDPPCDGFPTHGAHLEGIRALAAHSVATHEHSVLLALHAHGTQQ